jgi:hypothetical protein
MNDPGNFVFLALCWIAVFAVFFMFGWMFGREHQCTTMGAEYSKGKCVVVTRTEVAR